MTFPLPPKFWVPIFSSGFGSRDHTESPAHLDTRDWLSYGDLREAQSWARPPVSTPQETGVVLCASPGPGTSAPTPSCWRREESGNLGNNVQSARKLGLGWPRGKGSYMVTRDAARTQNLCSRSAGRAGARGSTLPGLCEGVESRSPAPVAYSARRNA